MAALTEAGVTATSLDQYVADLETAFQNALGADLDLAPETPQGQLIGVIAARLSTLDEAVVALGNAVSITTATGTHLSDLTSPFGIEYRTAQKSTATATLGGAGGTVVNAGSRASTTSGLTFQTTTTATIGTGGTVDVNMEAVDYGPVAAAIGTLTRIVDVVVGWDTVTNAAAAVLGRNAETSAELAARYRLHVARNARGFLDAILARVREVAGVSRVAGRENPTGATVTEQGVDIAARAIIVIVDGGDDADVAAAILATKAPGTPTVGTTTVGTISFERVDEVPVTVEMTLELTAGVFPSNGTDTIINGLIAYVAALAISEPADTTRLLAPIIAVPGHTINGAVTVERRAGGAGVTTRTDVGLAEKLTLVAADVTITIA